MNDAPVLNEAPCACHAPDLSKPKAPGLRVLLMTPYTGGNLGDAAIQDAVIHHFRKRVPECRLQLVTLCPRVTRELHGLPSFPLAGSGFEEGPSTANAAIPNANGGVARCSNGLKNSLRRVGWLRSIVAFIKRPFRKALSFLRAPRREFRHLLEAYRLLKQTDLLVMSGGGQIDDCWGGAFGHPYAMFKWAALSRLAGAPVVFPSVGVCALGSRTSRFFAHSALRLAAYRSYRDHGSKELLRDAAFTHADPEYPDLAFSHPCVCNASAAAADSSPKRLVVGISPIAYLSPRVWPERDPQTYERYLETLSEFTRRVLDAGHSVVLFTSARMDQAAVADLLEILRRAPGAQSWDGRLSKIVQSCLNDQLEVIRKMDLVVASRLHGIILSHLLGKPALAISYDRKVRAHMESMMQERHCLNLRECDAARLWKHFETLSSSRAAVSAVVHSNANAFSRTLDSQYDLLLQFAGAPARNPQVTAPGIREEPTKSALCEAGLRP